MADHSEQQLIGALRKADAAGDTEAARAIARRIQSMRQGAPASQGDAIAKYEDGVASIYDGSGTDRYGSQPASPRPEVNPSLFRLDSDFRKRSGVGAGDMLWAAAKDMFGSRQGAAEYLAKESGGAVGADDRGEPVLSLPGGQAYRLNDPGIDSTDAANVAGNVAAFMTPAGWANRVAQARNAGTLGRAALQGGALAATDAGLQTAFEGAIDPTRTALVGLSGAGGELVAGGLRGMAGRAAQGLDPIRQRAIQFAQERGIPLHLSQVSQSIPAKAMASMAQYLPFSGAGRAARQQQGAFNRAVGDTFGASGAEQLTDDVMRGARRNLSGQFEDIYSRNNVPLGEGGLRRLADVERGVASRLTEAESGVVRKQMDSILAELDDMGVLTGQKYQALRSQIMKAEGPDKVGQAVRELRGALDDIAATAVGPEDAARLRQIRGQWANFRTTEGLLRQVPGAGGDVKPSAIWPAIRKGSTQEMRELGRLGQTVMKNPVPDSGSPGRLLSLGLLGGGGVTGGLGAVPPLLALIGGGATVGRALNSPAAARLMLGGQRAAPPALNALSRLAAASGVASAPLVSKKQRRIEDDNGE